MFLLDFDWTELKTPISVVFLIKRCQWAFFSSFASFMRRQGQLWNDRTRAEREKTECWQGKKAKKDCEYVAVEVQDHPAQYKGLITTKKTQKIRLKGAALELPPGLTAPRTLRAKVTVFVTSSKTLFYWSSPNNIQSRFTLAFKKHFYTCFSWKTLDQNSHPTLARS